MAIDNDYDRFRQNEAVIVIVINPSQTTFQQINNSTIQQLFIFASKLKNNGKWQRI